MLSHAPSKHLDRYTITVLLVGAISYNACLAVLNAHLMPLTMTQVALCEFLLLAGVALAVLSRGISQEDEPCLILAAAFFIGALFLSFINGALVLEALRNIAIVVLFTMLGLRADERGVRLAFVAMTTLVLLFMLFELTAQNGYVAMFRPFDYYQNTRGIGEVDYDDVGLFGNALGFEGRFSFGIFKAPRTSSIFLEQTSLANFASVIAIYLMAMWGRFTRAERLLGIVFVGLALLSNNTRMSSGFALLCIAGYFLYPRLPRYTTLLLPLLMLGAAIVLTTMLGPSREDDLAGRLGLSVHLLTLTDLPASLGARATESGQFPDSGYSYVLYSSSLVGAVILWLYVAMIVPFKSDAQKRCAWSIGVFFFMNLLVAGNAIFSMKVAAPLWLLAGFMRSLSDIPEEIARTRAERLARAVPGGTALPSDAVPSENAAGAAAGVRDAGNRPYSSLAERPGGRPASSTWRGPRSEALPT